MQETNSSGSVFCSSITSEPNELILQTNYFCATVMMNMIITILFYFILFNDKCRETQSNHDNRFLTQIRSFDIASKPNEQILSSVV